MENKGKFMDNYLFNQKITVSKTVLKMLCHVALICTIYCITDMICTVACPEIEVVRFVSFSIMSMRPQKVFYQKIITRFISKTKDKLLTTTAIISFINNKTHCAYFNPLMPGGSKRSNSQT